MHLSDRISLHAMCTYRLFDRLSTRVRPTCCPTAFGPAIESFLEVIGEICTADNDLIELYDIDILGIYDQR